MLSLEHRKNLSKAHKGKKLSLETKQKISNSLKGRIFTEEWKKKIGDAHRGKKKNYKVFEVGKYYPNPGRPLLGKHREIALKNLIPFPKGHKNSKEISRKAYLGRKDIMPRGKNHYHWRGGKSYLYEMIRKLCEYKEWRKIIFERNNYICQECFIRGGALNAHHNKESFSQLLQNFLKIYSQFSPIDDKEILIKLAERYEPFWNIDNGITLCKKCHNKIKRRYQNRNYWQNFIKEGQNV